MAETPVQSSKFNLGIALSGGGARGFAHLGVLKAMEELNLKPDVISGVSAGSIIGVLYAAGYSPADILKLFKGLKFSDLTELSVPKDGFFKLDPFKRFLKKVLPFDSFDGLSIPTYVCATDMDNCKAVAFHSGTIIDKVAASCCIPIIFKPIKISGINYVDGGVLRNLPAWAIRNKCTSLFGVNVSPLVKRSYKPTIIDIAQRSYELMSKNNAINDMKICDLLIQAKSIATARTFQIRSMADIAQKGYDDAYPILENYKNQLRIMTNNE